jgi:death on curing protein
MTRFLTRQECLELHRRILDQSGGLKGVRDIGLLDSALAQPQMTFDGRELCPGIADKAAALAFSLICNHPFNDGNKRVGHAAMETFLVLNGWELTAHVDEQEHIIFSVASGTLMREGLRAWIDSHLSQRRNESGE